MQPPPPPWWEATHRRGLYSERDPHEDQHIPPFAPLALHLWWAPWFAIRNPPAHLRTYPIWVEVLVVSFVGTRTHSYSAADHTTQFYRIKAPSGSLELVPQTFVRSINIEVANADEADRRLHMASMPPPRAWNLASLRVPLARADHVIQRTAYNYQTIDRVIAESRPDNYAQEISSSSDPSTSSIATLLYTDDYGGNIYNQGASSSSTAPRM